MEPSNFSTTVLTKSTPHYYRSTLTAARLLRVLFVTLLLTGFLAANGCGSSRPERKPADSGVIAVSVPKNSSPPVEREIFVAPKPPWELSEIDDFGSARLRSADTLSANGELEQAILAYRELEHSPETFLVGKAAFNRRLSSMLKLGRSKEVLDELSSYVKRSNGSIENLAPELSLLAAFSYMHRNNSDQAFAWFGLAHRQSQAQGPVSEAARQAVKEIVEGLGQANFDQALEKWRADVFLSPIFAQERLRRVDGGQPVYANQTNWFVASTYRNNASNTGELGSSVFDPPATYSDENQYPTALGVLLPLTGQYAAHGGQVKKGIELALAEIAEDSRPQVFFEDTRGEEFVAAEAYQRLINDHKVSFVLGPLLSKTTDRVAEASLQAGVGILTFTKRLGIANLGQTVFRLGTTNQGQVVDLVQFASTQLRLRNFAVLYPDGSTGVEFSDLFVEEVRKAGVQLVLKQTYNRDDQLSLDAAVMALERAGAEVVFIPDTIESAYPLISLLRQPRTDGNGQQLEVGNKVVLMGPAIWDDQVAIRGYGPMLDGSFYVTPFNVQSQDPYIMEFVERFKAAYTAEPDILSAQGYDALRLVAHVLKTSGGSRLRLLDSLKQVKDFPGVSGMLSVSSDGEISRPMRVIRMENGDTVEVSQFGLAPAQTGLEPPLR